MSKTVLIVGGTSGLGLELARQLKGDHDVVIVGRQNPNEPGTTFIPVMLDGIDTHGELEGMLLRIQPVDLLIYAAGFGQEKKLTGISEEEIDAMIKVGLRAPIQLLQMIFLLQGTLPGFIAITSTAQFTPRPLESVYCATKAGLGMFAESIAMDERMRKTLVVAPGGMQTPFRKGTSNDTTGWLDPKWVAEQIIDIWGAPFSYKMIRILRGPARVEHREERV